MLSKWRTFAKVVLLVLIIVFVFSCTQTAQKPEGTDSTKEETAQDKGDKLVELLSDKNNWTMVTVFGTSKPSSTSNVGIKSLVTSSQKPFNRVIYDGDFDYTMAFDYYTHEKTNTSESPFKVYILRSSGLVGDFLETLYVDDEYIFVSSWFGGYSYFKWDALENPKGNIKNILIPIDIGYIPGNVEFAKSPVDGKIYARYCNMIINALTGEILFTNGPDPTNGTYGCSPKERFVIDDFGYFWIGASEYEDNSSLQNGLYKISPDFSSMKMILPDAVWQIYMDSSKNIWVIATTGIYKFVKEESGYSEPMLVFDSTKENMWGEMVIEYNGTIYFLVKNFYIYPHSTPVKEFWLYKLSDEGKPEFVADVGTQIASFYNYDNFNLKQHLTQMNLFVYEDKLCVNYHGNSTVFEFQDNTIKMSLIGLPIGQSRVKPIKRGDYQVLVSVGNIIGISFYNLRGDGEVFVFNQVMTSDKLVSNYIHNIFVDEETGKVYISHLTNGYTLINGDDMKAKPLKSRHPNYNFLSTDFFKHNGKLYVSASDEMLEVSDAEEFPKQIGILRTNGEKIYYHEGKIWSFLNGGSTDKGKMGYMDLETLEVIATDKNEYRNAVKTIPWEQNYQIFDIIAADSSSIFIGVGSSFGNNYDPFPFVLQYKYEDNSITKVPLSDNTSRGIFKFVKDENGNILGISNGKVFKYTDGKWEVFTEIYNIHGRHELDLKDAVMLKNYLVIIYSNLIEIVNLHSGKYTVIENRTLGLPYPRCAKVSKNEKFYRLWIGTFHGLAYIDIPNEIFEEQKELESKHF
ncbi:hypothetical protein [Fervidobacterium islandicum]|uniref:hypothetical protein n=1 Tax=Fervidobacterium islandicum TaxID=2423 RepID=UPI003A62823D